MGDFVELTAALLPCVWGYAEIAERLAGGGTQADERYGRWIAIYAPAEFAELAGWARVSHQQPLKARVLASGLGRRALAPVKPDERAPGARKRRAWVSVGRATGLLDARAYTLRHACLS